MCQGIIFSYLCPHVYPYELVICDNCAANGKNPYQNFTRERLAKLCDGCQKQYDRLSGYRTGNHKRKREEKDHHREQDVKQEPDARAQLQAADAGKVEEEPKGQMTTEIGKDGLPNTESPKKEDSNDPAFLPPPLRFTVGFRFTITLNKEDDFLSSNSMGS